MMMPTSAVLRLKTVMPTLSPMACWIVWQSSFRPCSRRPAAAGGRGRCSVLKASRLVATNRLVSLAMQPYALTPSNFQADCRTYAHTWALTARGCCVKVANVLPQHRRQVPVPHVVHLPHACRDGRSGAKSNALLRSRAVACNPGCFPGRRLPRQPASAQHTAGRCLLCKPLPSTPGRARGAAPTCVCPKGHLAVGRHKRADAEVDKVKGVPAQSMVNMEATNCNNSYTIPHGREESGVGVELGSGHGIAGRLGSHAAPERGSRHAPLCGPAQGGPRHPPTHLLT